MRTVCCLAILAAACVQGATGAAVGDAISVARADPIEIRDAFGRNVTLRRAPQRIIPIFASNTELVAALGLADRIVGIEAFTRYPPEILDRPLVGGRLGFSVDAMVALKPDLVVVTPSREAANTLIDPMQRLGIPIIVLLQRSMAEIMSNIRLLGVATGVPERGEQVAATLEARLAAITRRVEHLKPPSVIMITGRVGSGLLLVVRAGTYTGAAIELAGARLAFGNRTSIAQVSPEAILNADPDVLLYGGTAAQRDEFIRQPGWKEMRAVRDGRVYAVSRPELLIPGPRTIDGVEHLAMLFHPPGPTQ